MGEIRRLSVARDCPPEVQRVAEMLEALANRAAGWQVTATCRNRARPVQTFEGGTVTFVFRASTVGGHEISTMYVDPPDEQTT